MKLLQTLVVLRDDLGEEFKVIPIKEIYMYMFPFFSTGVLLHEDFVVFIDTDGSSRIIKNRLGLTQ